MNAISVARVLAVSLVGKIQVWNVVKRRQCIVLTVIGMAMASFAMDTNERDEIIFAGWGSTNRDSIYYLPSKQAKNSFYQYWKFKNLRKMHAACGYTYEVFKSNKIDPVKNIASVNLDCGLVGVDGGTYIGQLKPVWKALKSAKLGKVRIDTIYDSTILKSWLNKNQSNESFLGFQFLNDSYSYNVSAIMPLQHDSTSPMRNDTIESFRKYYASILKATNLRYEDVMQFKVRKDSITTSTGSFNIYNTLSSKTVRSLIAGGCNIDTIRIGLFVKSFYK